jgi:hypothetical protein
MGICLLRANWQAGNSLFLSILLFLKDCWYALLPFSPMNTIFSVWHGLKCKVSNFFLCVQDIIQSMPHDAHPMGVLASAMSTLSVFHPDANPALKVSTA